MRRRYKQPNGYGCIYKSKERRRRPYRAVITAERTIVDGKAKQVRKTIGYYETEDLALEAIMQYRATKYDIDKSKITFAEVYESWSAEHLPTLVPNSQRNLRNAYRHVPGLHSLRMGDIRTAQLEAAVRSATVGVATKKKIVQLLSMMYDWAMAHDVVQKDYSSLCNYRLGPEEPNIQRVLFSPEEIHAMENGDQLDDMVLFSLYTGVRPTELVTIKTADVDLEQGIIICGIKTEAGKNRVIPIHPNIIHLTEKYSQLGYENLFSSVRGNGKHYPYHTYRQKFTERYTGHTCYDTRHTFSTRWKEQSLNEHILKLIMGHKENDVTERFYTHRDIENLKSEMHQLDLFYTN